MEYYDVIIIGAGIAGCGLAYNLKRIGYKGSVLVIDKNEIGSHKGYGHRNTFAHVIKEYNLEITHKYKGVKLGVYDKVIATMHGDFYGINYEQICQDLFKRSGHDYRKEEALNVLNQTLVTDKNKFKFKYLIDCSGYHFFLRKLFKMPLPFRYWKGRTRLLKNKTSLDKDYIYYAYGEGEFFEDVYIVGDKLAQGDWIYCKNLDSRIPFPKKSFYTKHCSDEDVILMRGVVIPITPVLPLTFKNYAFLGDSFGNAVPISVYGIETILKTSKLLVDAIKKDNLKSYEKEWKKDNFDIYLKRLVIKLDTHLNFSIVKKIKRYPHLHDMLKLCNKYPQFYIDMLQKQYQPFEIPEEVKNKYPKQRKLWMLGYYLYLKSKYLKMNLLSKFY